MTEITKPSQIVHAMIEAIRTHMDVYPFEVRLGGECCTNKGAFCVISEGPLTAMKVFELTPAEVAEIEKDRNNSKLSFFLFAAENLGAGLPYYIFEFLGIPEKFVKPRVWWFMVNLNYKTHIQYVEMYYQQLVSLGL